MVLLIRWTHKVSEMKANGTFLSPEEIAEVTTIQQAFSKNRASKMSTSTLLSRILTSCTFTWIVGLPHLAMNAAGLELTSLFSAVQIDLWNDLCQANYTIPWFMGHCTFHSTIVKVFTDSLTKPGQVDGSLSGAFRTLYQSSSILQMLAHRFCGLGKYANFVQTMIDVFCLSNPVSE
jgi:hypothetical protein